jgi:hypothetical protein
MKKFIFYIILFTPPVLIAAPLIYVIFVSLMTYVSLNFSEVNAGYNKLWIRFATDIYYKHDANIWQNQDDCVDYDEILLYKPSTGCFFSNQEYSTKLSFSQEGRTWDGRLKFENQRPIFVLGDSVSMGWGVNDDETFSYILENTLSMPFYNLSVSSYGTAREISKAIHHPEFETAKYLIIQYHSNDLFENDYFLMQGALPQPTHERFESQLKTERKKLTVLQTFGEVFNHIQRERWSFFGFPFGYVIFEVVESTQKILRFNISTNQERADDEAEKEPVTWPRVVGSMAVHSDVFLKIIGHFPELNAKTIYVWGADVPLSTYLSNNVDLPDNIIPINVTGGGGKNQYPIDRHPNARGHRILSKTMLKALKEQGALESRSDQIFTTEGLQ